MTVDAPPVPVLVSPSLSAHAVLPAAVGAGLVVGAATSFGQTALGGTPLAGLANAVSPWLVVPFLLGVLARTRRVAAVAGLLVCGGEVAGYYLVADLRGYAVGSWVLVWAVAGLLGGPLFGVAGRSWLTATGRWRGAGAALLVGCWTAEAVVTYGFVLRRLDEAAVFAVVAVLLAVVLARVGRQGRALLRLLPAATLVGVGGFVAVHAALA